MDYLDGLTVITSLLVRGSRGGQSPRRCGREAEGSERDPGRFSVAGFVMEKGHDPRSAGGLSKLEKSKKPIFL